MTSPIQALPTNTSLGGNLGTEVGQAGNSFIQGLLSQRMRSQQLAMQQAAQQAQAGALQQRGELEQAQGEDLRQQALSRGHDNEPIGQDQVLRLSALMGGQAKPEMFTGMNRGEGDALEKLMRGMALFRGMQINNTEENALRSSYDREAKAARTGIDNYRETLNAYKLASQQDNPIAGEGMLLSWLKQRTNRMNQAEISRVASLGGVENIAHRAMSYITGQVPSDPQVLRQFLDASTPGGTAHYHDYQGLRSNYRAIAIRKGLNPDNIVTDEDYAADIPGLEQSIATPRQGPVGGMGTGGNSFYGVK